MRRDRMARSALAVPVWVLVGASACTLGSGTLEVEGAAPADSVESEAGVGSPLPLMGPSTSGLVNYARTAVASASTSYGPGWTPERAIDGVVAHSSKWVSDGTDHGHAWIQMDLGTTRALYELVMHQTQAVEAPGWRWVYDRYEVAESAGGPWTEVAPLPTTLRWRHKTSGVLKDVRVDHLATGNAYSGAPEDVHNWLLVAVRSGFNHFVRARYLRVNFLENSPDRHVRLPEVELYGKALTGAGCVEACLKRRSCVGYRGAPCPENGAYYAESCRTQYTCAPPNPILDGLAPCLSYCQTRAVTAACASCTARASCEALIPAAFGGGGACDAVCGQLD